MRSFGTVLQFCVYNWLPLLCAVKAAAWTSSLEKRMDDYVDGHGVENPDLVTFDGLFWGDRRPGRTFFAHRPRSIPPTSSESEEMFPNTYFFRGRPLFLTDANAESLLSKNEMLQAYNAFGKFHIVDTTFGPRTFFVNPGHHNEHNREYDLMSQYMLNGHPHSAELENYAKHLQAVERLYGKSIARVYFGPTMLRSATDVRDYRLRYPDYVEWKTIGDAAPLPHDHNLSPAELRARLRRDRFVKVQSQDGRSSLALRFDIDGTLQKGGFGDIDRDLLDFV